MNTIDLTISSLVLYFIAIDPENMAKIKHKYNRYIWNLKCHISSRGYISSRYSKNSEEDASEFLENRKEIFPCNIYWVKKKYDYTDNTIKITCPHMINICIKVIDVTTSKLFLNPPTTSSTNYINPQDSLECLGITRNWKIFVSNRR